MIEQSHKSHMYLSHMLQRTIQNRTVHSFLLNDALWDKGQVLCGIYELGQLRFNALNPMAV